MDAERPFVIEGSVVTFNKYVGHDFEPFLSELEVAYEASGASVGGLSAPASSMLRRGCSGQPHRDSRRHQQQGVHDLSPCKRKAA